MLKYLSAFLLALAPLRVSNAIAQDAAAEAAIRAIIAEQVVAWNAGDVACYVNHLAIRHALWRSGSEGTRLTRKFGRTADA